MKKFNLGIIALSIFLLFSCNDSNKVNFSERTILFYLAADGHNSLSNRLVGNINGVLSSWNKNYKGSVVIYSDLNGKVPVLMSVKYTNGEAKLDTLTIYEEQNSADPKVFSKVINDAFGKFPAESYGIVAGSHGTGWMPQGASFQARSLKMQSSEIRIEEKLARAFGYDNGNVMDIKDFVDVLPNNLDFFLFDLCFMGSIEVLYEMKDKASYIIASPAEVPLAGFPYDKILPYLWSEGDKLKSDLTEVCKYFVESYENTQSDTRFATIALIDTKELNGLYSLSSQVLNGKISEAAEIEFNAIFKYPLVDVSTYIYYDFAEYMKYMASEEQFNAIAKQLEKVVLYKNKTSLFYRQEIPDDKFSGITSFIPRSAWSNQLDYYFTLDWAKGVYNK